MNTPPKATPRPAFTSTDCSAHRPRVESEQILHGNRTVEINHDGQRYLLRVTRENKLILTK